MSNYIRQLNKYQNSGLGATVSGAESSRLVAAFQNNALAQIDALNSRLAVLVRPLAPAIDRMPYVSDSYKQMLKSRPLDALFELNRPIEGTLLEVVNWVNRSDFPDGGKGKTVRSVGFPKMRINVDMSPVSPDDARLPTNIRNWVQRARLITQVLILIVHAPIATGAAMLKFFGKNFLVDPLINIKGALGAGVSQVTTDAQILAHALSLHALALAATSPEALAVALPAGKYGHIATLCNDAKKAFAEAKATTGISAAGATIAGQGIADMEAAAKRLANAYAAFTKGQAITEKIVGVVTDTVKSTASKFGIGGLGGLYAEGDYSGTDDYTDCGLGWYDENFNLGVTGADDAVVAGGAGGGGTTGTVTSGGTSAGGTAATAKVASDTIAPEVLAAIAIILQTARESGLTEQAVKEAAEAAKNANPAKAQKEEQANQQNESPQAKAEGNGVFMLAAAGLVALLLLKR